MSDKCKCGGVQCAGGLSWFAFWLFTIGFLGLSFWKGVLAILLWPYYMGMHVASLLK